MPSCTDPRRLPGRAEAAGFTLLEVVIALAIAALALIALFHAGGGGLFAADIAARIEEAIERAQSHLSAFGRAGAITAGWIGGDDGDGYHWELRASPIARAPALGASLVLYDVTVGISWRDGSRTRTVTLETRRLGAAPAGE